MRFVQIVCIQEGKQIAAAGLYSGVSSCRGATLGSGRPAQHLNSGIGCRNIIGDLDAVVGRAIVDQHELPIRNRLGSDAGDRFAQICLRIEEGGYDCHPRQGSHR